MKRRLLWVLAILALFIVAATLALTQVQVGALPRPGRAEQFVATQIRRFVIYRESRSGVPPPPQDLQASIAQGETSYGTDCSMCHGMDGHTPTDTGRWMYPRAADLTSSSVQAYSDPELFWIIKNGIRFSGMPGFGKVESDEHIWDLVNYIRRLKKR
jgi:mono/diheme cytochrome c family protein